MAVPPRPAGAFSDLPPRGLVHERVEGRLSPAFRMFGDAREFSLVDLTQAPEAALTRAQVEAGRYWIVTPERRLCVPGTFGIVGIPRQDGQSEDDWFASQMTAGYLGVEQELQARRMLPTLDPWEEVPQEFLPAGARPGGYLRRTAVRQGRHDGWAYHTVWERLEERGADDPARVALVSPVLYGCWRAWLTRQGRLPPADAGRVLRRRGQLEEHVARVQALPEITEAERARRVKAAQSHLVPEGVPVLRAE